jgi:hypothetical protein
VHRSFLAALPARLADAVSADELEHATRPSAGPGVTRSAHEVRLWVDDRLVPGPVPGYVLSLDPPADARELCGDWRLERPVAVSPDVHQHTWQILVAGEELQDPHNKRIASQPIAAGRWEVLPRLDGRPPGELPTVVSGASPAYDVLETGGAVRQIEIRPRLFAARTLKPTDPDARALLEVMIARHPAWQGGRGEGWDVDPGATFVAVYDGGEPAAGAATIDAGEGIARASQICVTGGSLTALALLDVLEALAREGGFARLRLESSAFLFSHELAYTRCGFETGPPYDGDADVEVWTEKTL